MNDASRFDLPLGQIGIPDNRARSLDPDWAEALAGLIRAQGLIHPITVRRNDAGDGYILVAGRHRLEAFHILGADEIPVCLSAATTEDEARLEEVLENLGRNELTALDRCQHLFELKQVYEKLYPEARHGGDRRSDDIKRKSFPLDPAGQDEPQVFGFARANADKVGMGERAIKLAVKIWSDLTDDSRSRLIGTKWALKQSEIRLLSQQKPKWQAQILDLLLDPDGVDDTVSDAFHFVSKGTRAIAVNRKFDNIAKSFKALADPDFDRLVVLEEERILAALKRQGRL